MRPDAGLRDSAVVLECRPVSDEFGRRLRDLVEGVRSVASEHWAARAGTVAEARARRKHLEKIVQAEATSMLRSAEGVLAGMGLRTRFTPEELKVEPIPGARIPERYPPWLLLRCREPGMEDARVVVLEVTWRVDDPRTPLPEAPNTLRFVVSDDSAAGLAEVRDFLTVAFEDFASSVAKFDVFMKP